MAVLTKVGSFAIRSTTGSQAITGVGFQPKAIIFWSAPNSSTSGSWTGNYFSTLGFTAGPSNSYACSAYSRDNSATSDTGRRMAAKCISMETGGAQHEADLTSFDADGFTINVTTATSGLSGAICYMAIGGTDITGAKVVNWTTPTAVGSKAVTGVGFKPDLVFNASDTDAGSVPASFAGAYLSLGAMNKHGQQWSNSIVSSSGVNPSNTSRFQQTDATLATVNSDEAVLNQAHFSSMDVDGFTLYHSTANATARTVISLCLQGVSSKIGAFAKTTAAAPAAQSITRVGFTPRAVLTSAIDANATGTPAAAASFSLGASDGTNSRLTDLSDSDNVSPTVAKSLFISGAIANRSNGAGSTLATASLSTMDTDGFSLSWNPNDSAAIEVLYLAIGDAGVNTFPSDVSV